MELVDNSRHDVQNFRLSGIWNVLVVVKEDGLKQRRNHVCVHHL